MKKTFLILSLLAAAVAANAHSNSKLEAPVQHAAPQGNSPTHLQSDEVSDPPLVICSATGYSADDVSDPPLVICPATGYSADDVSDPPRYVLQPKG